LDGREAGEDNMALPQFLKRFLAESATTTTINIVKGFNQLNDNLDSIFQALLKKVQLDSVLLQNIPLNPGVNQISHTLGRVLTGWTVIRLSGPAVIYDMQATNPNPGLYLILNSSIGCNVSLLVF